MPLFISLFLCLAPILAIAQQPQLNQSSGVASIITSDPNRITLSFNYSSVACQQVTEQARQYEQMTIEGEGIYFVKGDPILPAVSRLIVVPADKSIEMVVQEGTKRTVPLNLPPLLCNELPPDKQESDLAQSDPNQLIPPATAVMSEPMVIRGVRLVQVTTYPVQYDPRDNSYVVHDNLEANLQFGNDTPINPASHPIRRHRSQSFLKFIQGIAVNGDQVGRDDPDYNANPPYVGHYLVVAHSAVMRYAVPFIEWRRKGGYKVDILSVPNNQAGNTNWIKGQIQDLYDSYLANDEDPFDFLLLIGDHNEYGGNIPGPSNVLSTPRYGWDYACLEGRNDDNADVGISQWIAGDQSQMTLNTGRTLAYEMTPEFEDTDWFKSAGIFSQHWGGNWNPSLNTNVRWAREILKMRHFDDVRFLEDLDANNNGQTVTDFIYDQYEDGVNLLFGRAQAYPIYGSWGNLRQNPNVFPIYINYAGHQEMMTWMMMRGWDGQRLKGPVAGTDIYGAPQTYSNSMLWLESINSLIQRELPFGWVRVNSVLAPQLYIPNFAQNDYNKLYTSTYGDPGLQAWIGVPHEVHAEFPEGITSSTRRVQVRVLSNDDDAPFANAQVTLYLPGNLPAANDATYATYDDMQMMTGKSNENGIAEFVFDEGAEFVSGTQMFVTVTGRDVKPFLGSSDIATPQSGVELGVYELAQQEGNNDEYPNPGERFSLRFTAKNIGDTRAVEQVTASITTDSPYLQVEDQQISFGDIEVGSENEPDRNLGLTFSPDCPDGVSRPATSPIVTIHFASGDLRWTSAIRLQPHAPNFEVRNIVGGNTIPDTSTRIEIEVTNVGSAPSRHLYSRLLSLGIGVGVRDAELEFPVIQPGETARVQNGGFPIYGNDQVVPGSSHNMLIFLYDDIGFIDTATFTLKVSSARARSPMGPDKYGYICYDDTDEGWDAKPVYDWIEIDPRSEDADFEGIEVRYDGQSPYEMGEVQTVDLPFNLRFYGMDFDQISIASNGYIQPGFQQVVNYQNWPLDRCIGGGAGMIAPFWDYLQWGNNGKIFTYFNEENGKFYVEWSRMQVVGDNNDQTFEVVFSDPALWVSETGDPNILFQYKSIRNLRGTRTEWVEDSPYASVGISSPMGNSGLSYTFNNVYPVNNAALENRRAVLFSTLPLELTGFLYGWVNDAATLAPVVGTKVRTRHGYFDVTDENGYWSISKAPTGVPFTIIASKIGYNDSALVDLQVEDSDTMEISFNLLHPEFNISDQRLGAQLYVNDSLDIPFELANTGNGPLNWSAEKRLPGNADLGPWELRLNFSAADTVDDDRLEGVVFADNQFYVSGSNGTDSSMIYVLDRHCSFVRQFEQPTHTRYGMKDLDWDGANLWGSGDSVVTSFTTEGEVVSHWRAPANPTNNIAYDSERNLLWLSGTTTDIIGVDLEGNVVQHINRRSLRMYGLSYWPDDPDGYNLYLTTNPGQDRAPLIYKMNTSDDGIPDGDTIMVSSIELPDGSTGINGGFITNQYDVYSWVYLVIPNQPRAIGNDRIHIYQLDARKDWMELDQYSGLLQAGESHNFTLSLNTIGLPDTLFEGMMVFTHNADDNQMILDIDLTVTGPPMSRPSELLTPADGDTLVALPLHGDTLHVAPVQFTWSRTINPIHPDSLVGYVFHLTTGQESYSTNIFSTELLLNLDTLDLPVTFESRYEWWVTAIVNGELIESLSHFHFSILPDNIDRLSPNKPVVFGIDEIYPSPFNSTTTIKFGIDRSLKTTLTAYDISGRRMAVLYDGTPEVGYLRVPWNGQQLSSGVYVLRLESAGRTSIRKVALIR